MFWPSTYVRNSRPAATAVRSSSGNTSNGGKRPRNSPTSCVFTGSTLGGLSLFFPCTDSFVLSRWPPGSHRPQGGCMAVSPDELDYAGGGLGRPLDKLCEPQLLGRFIGRLTGRATRRDGRVFAD